MKNLNLIILCVLFLSTINAQDQFTKFSLSSAENISSIENQFKSLSKEDPILGNGIFLDFAIGGFLYTQEVFNNITYEIEEVNKSAFTLGLRFGSKWYFGNSNLFKTGLGVKWIDFRFSITGDEFALDENYLLSTSLLSVGSANVIKFNENMGLELNFYICPTFANDIENSTAYLGFTINPCIKFRYKKLSVGLDISYLWANYADSLDEILPENIAQGTYLSLVTGVKF